MISIMHLNTKSADRKRATGSVEHFEKQVSNVYDRKTLLSTLKLDNILDRFNISRQDKHHPVYLGKSNVLDFTISIEYGVDDITFIRSVMDALDPRSTFDTEAPNQYDLAQVHMQAMLYTKSL